MKLIPIRSDVKMVEVLHYSLHEKTEKVPRVMRDLGIMWARLQKVSGLLCRNLVKQFLYTVSRMLCCLVRPGDTDKVAPGGRPTSEDKSKFS